MGSKKLYRTEGPCKMVAGVCGGLGSNNKNRDKFHPAAVLLKFF